MHLSCSNHNGMTKTLFWFDSVNDINGWFSDLQKTFELTQDPRFSKMIGILRSRLVSDESIDCTCKMSTFLFENEVAEFLEVLLGYTFYANGTYELIKSHLDK